MLLFNSRIRQNDDSVCFTSTLRLISTSDLTINRTAAIDAVKYELGSPTVYFYCMNEHPAFLDASSILCSFIKQLCEYLHRTSSPYPEGTASAIDKFFGHNRVKPDLDDITDIFTCFFTQVKDIVYVIDGVDALERNDARFLLELFRSLFADSTSRKGSQILLLSRDQVPGYINLETFMPGIRHISTSANVMQDIEAYIESSIADKTMSRKLTDDHILLAEVQRRLLAESLGMYVNPRYIRPYAFYSVGNILTSIGSYGFISSWKFFGIHATQMQIFGPH